jgi:hypothetical protein
VSAERAKTGRGRAPAYIIGAIAAAILVITILHVLGAGPPHPPPVPPQPAPPKPAPAGSPERALLEPLAPGSPLGALDDGGAGFQIVSISVVDHGGIEIIADRGRARVRLYVYAAGGTARPAASAGPFALFYNADRLTGATVNDGPMLAQALASSLATHSGRPAPPGLAVFVPSAVDGGH